MKYETFKKYIKRSGLTVKEFAELLKYNPSSISNLKDGKIPNNLIVIAVLLSECVYRDLDPKELFESMELSEREGHFKNTFGGKTYHSLNANKGK
jgi:transcriptional regulator with XRE-family HTH domain